MPPSTPSHNTIKRQFISLGRPASLHGINKKRCERFRYKHYNWANSAASPSRLRDHLKIYTKYEKTLRNNQSISSAAQLPIQANSEPPREQRMITESGVNTIPKHETKAINNATALALISNERNFGIFKSFRFLSFFKRLRPN